MQCQIPDPVPRKPGFALPPGATDCHAHVYGRKYPASGKGWYQPPAVEPVHYLELLDAIGLARGVLVHTAYYGRDHAVCLDLMAAAGGRLRGVAYLDGQSTPADVRLLDKAGFRGFRVNLVSGVGAQLDEARALAALVAPFGWHMQVLLDAEKLPELDTLFASFPIKVVVDHMGRPDPLRGVDAPGFRAVLRHAASGRGWVKLTAPYRTSRMTFPYADMAGFARALVDAAPDRLVWGTDWPHATLEAAMPNDGDLCSLLGEWVPDAAVRNRILADNPARLYGFD
jgi:2-pyrone-4,6-dicarboxylate lactonase